MAPRLSHVSTRTWYHHHTTSMLLNDVFHMSKDFHLAFGTNFSLASLVNHPWTTWMFGVCNVVAQVPCRRDRLCLWSPLKWNGSSTHKICTLSVRSNPLTKFAHHNLPFSVYRYPRFAADQIKTKNLRLYTDGVVRSEMLSNRGCGCECVL